MADDNVTPIRPPKPDPDWLAAANSVSEDFAEEPGPPAALDTSIPAGKPYPEVDISKMTQTGLTVEDLQGVAALSDSLGLAPGTAKSKGPTEGITAAMRRQLEEGELNASSALISDDEGNTYLSPEAQDIMDLAAKRRQDRSLDRLRVEDEAARATQEFYEKVEQAETAHKKQYQEIDPLRRAPFIFALVVAILIFATSALFSFPAVAATAELMLPVWPWLVFVVPGFIEAFIIFFGVDTVIWQGRAAKSGKYTPGQQAQAQKMSSSALVWMLVFTGVSVISNAAHTFMGYEILGGLGTWQAWLGIAFASLAPLSVVLITKRVSRLVFIYSIKE